MFLYLLTENVPQGLLNGEHTTEYLTITKSKQRQQTIKVKPFHQQANQFGMTSEKKIVTYQHIH